jgi:hypothetical protein
MEWITLVLAVYAAALSSSTPSTPSLRHLNTNGSASGYGGSFNSKALAAAGLRE